MDVSNVFPDEEEDEDEEEEEEEDYYEGGEEGEAGRAERERALSGAALDPVRRSIEVGGRRAGKAHAACGEAWRVGVWVGG